MVNRRKPMLWVAWASFALAACVAPVNTSTSEANAIPKDEIPYGTLNFACDGFPEGNVFLLEQELSSDFELFTTSEASTIHANQCRLEHKRKGFASAEATSLGSLPTSSMPRLFFTRRISDGCSFAFAPRGMQFLSSERRHGLFSKCGSDHLSGRLDYSGGNVHSILPHVNDEPTAREPYQEAVFRGAKFLYCYYKDISQTAETGLNASRGKKFKDFAIQR